MPNAVGCSLKTIFPNLGLRYAQRIKREVAATNLPMVNAGARFDRSVLIDSGSRHGIFVDERDYCHNMVSDLRQDEEVSRVEVDQIRGHYPIRVSFRYEGVTFRIEYHKDDIRNLDRILRGRSIALYYSAIQGGPNVIPNAGFDCLALGGYMVASDQIGDPMACLDLTGMQQLRALSRDEDDPGFIEGYLYQKVRDVGPIATRSIDTWQAFCYLQHQADIAGYVNPQPARALKHNR